MAFPVTRLRRLRRTAEIRNLVSETRLTPEAFGAASSFGRNRPAASPPRAGGDSFTLLQLLDDAAPGYGFFRRQVPEMRNGAPLLQAMLPLRAFHALPMQ